MQVLILEKNQIAIEELKKELLIIKQDALELSLNLLIHVKNVLLQFFMSYKDYSLSNIKEYGLAEILWVRAMRFFRLDNNDPDKKESKARDNNKQKRGGKYWIRRTSRIIMYPFYLLILLLELIFKEKSKRRKEKRNIYVKNNYIE